MKWRTYGHRFNQRREAPCATTFFLLTLIFIPYLWSYVFVGSSSHVFFLLSLQSLYNITIPTLTIYALYTNPTHILYPSFHCADIINCLWGLLLSPSHCALYSICLHQDQFKELIHPPNQRRFRYCTFHACILCSIYIYMYIYVQKL